MVRTTGYTPYMALAPTGTTSPTGRTTRQVILPALIELSFGNDVYIVAFDSEQAVLIAQQVCRWAKRMSIPCYNVDQLDGSPHVRARSYDQFSGLPTPKSKVLFDHTARFDRTSYRPPAVCTVTG